jgi:hypothetical protein
MFESDCYIFIEMEYIAGDQLKRVLDKRLQAVRREYGILTQEDYRKRQLHALIKQRLEAIE